MSRLAVLVALLVVAVSCTSDDGQEGATADDGPDTLPASIQEIIDEPRFDTAVWGIRAVNLDTGEVVADHNAQVPMLPGSTPKLFSAAAALDAFGPDHRFVTPVYAVGDRTGSTLSGSLVLVASGDLIMGGRAGPDDTVEFTNGDHNDANALPFGSLTPQDPLAGLTTLAEQVAAAGITEVRGDVLIDDRLFESNDDFASGLVSPIVINDNLVDVTTTPGADEGDPATVEWRPVSPAYTVESEVVTGAAGEEPDVTITANEDETVLTVTGEIAVDADPLIRVYEVEDPAAFARTLFIEELSEAGVVVTAAPVGPNTASGLPAPEAYEAEVASIESPPLREITKLVLKVSYNRGADLLTCLLATTVDSTDCTDGMVVEGDFLERAGLPAHSYVLFDGAGASDKGRVAADGATALLTYVAGQPWGATFKASLPVLGESGSLAMTEVEGPAIGNVYAKTGTGAWAFPTGQEGIFVGVKALAGYIDAASGAPIVFGVYVNNAVAADLDELLNIGVDQIAAALYEEN